MVRGVKTPPLLRVGWPLGMLALAGCSTPAPSVVSLGNHTYSITRQAGSGLVRDTEKLKADALDAASAYCTQQHKELKVLSATAEKPNLMLTGYARAKVVFQALDANDPELRTPAVSAPTGITGATAVAADAASPSTDALYHDLVKLDDLRKRGILTEEEFQAQKKKVLERSN